MRRLQGIKTIVKRQERILAKGDTQPLLPLHSQNRRTNLLRAPAVASSAKLRFFHFCTVVGLIP